MQRPAIDLIDPAKLETATFSMGCFWSPDAIFGCMEGVVSTRVGYAGGSTENPTYKQLEDHIETVQVDYDPDKACFSAILDLFFDKRTPIREPWKRQYASAFFYHDDGQKQQILERKGALEAELGQKVYTEVNAFEAFYLAEERHQKYKLQRQPELLAEFRAMYPGLEAFVNSTAAARVNGYLYGCGDCERLSREVDSFGLSPRGQKILLDTATNTNGIACSKVLKQQ
ncbi:peptide-methionine (S)-S-oxide reductase MsrA [Cesiribacter sp. SM1]|uniref:peptide-methionine (S)-S-oxide reductase MsrA n=1 Tax=Cesiribacter sp. SM1 TaxID=2861196 RepID=UPI001CD60B2C|nr:peptide-methionine (S)-S-oxide reductase MsrA [Cesiribacter sp. SM1]